MLWHSLCYLFLLPSSSYVCPCFLFFFLSCSRRLLLSFSVSLCYRSNPPFFHHQVYCSEHAAEGRRSGHMLSELDTKLSEDELRALAWRVERLVLPAHVAIPETQRDGDHALPLRETVTKMTRLLPVRPVTRSTSTSTSTST